MLLELTVAEQRFNAVMESCATGSRWSRSPSATASAAKPFTAGCAATEPAGWTPWPTAPIDPAAARTRCRPRSGPSCASSAAAIQAGANAASLGTPRPMELWQLDVMGGIWLADGRELKAVTGIDHHSRFCVAAGLIERANARSVCRVFTAALARYGTPRKSSRQRQGLHRPARSPPGRGAVRPCLPRTRDHPPAHRGPLPDHHRQDRTLPQGPAGRAGDRPPLRLPPPRPTGAWWLVSDYTLRRPHQAIAMQVPARRFQPPIARRFQPPIAPAAPVPADQARQPPTLGPTETTRRVSTSGRIGVCYQQASAGRHLAGQVVTVRLHPSVLQVFFAGQPIRTVPRRSTKEVVQLRAHRPHQPRRPTTT